MVVATGFGDLLMSARSWDGDLVTAAKLDRYFTTVRDARHACLCNVVSLPENAV